MNYDKIGNFIQQRRKSKNLTQKQLAEKLNVTDRAISKWERGQGCPDVSILEILSKELDCSILELLKGREIENEVIPVTEADDYIKESMKFSELKVKNVFNKIIEITLIFIIVLLGYLNIVQMLYIDKKYEITPSSDNVIAYKEKSNKISKNIELIRSNQGKYNSDDYNIILQELDEAFKNIKNTRIYNIVISNTVFEYSINDLAFISSSPYIIKNTYAILDILKKYDNSSFINDFNYVAISNLKYKYNSIYQTYKYRLTFNSDAGDYQYDIENSEVFDSITQTDRHLIELLYLTEMVKEVGDIHE